MTITSELTQAVPLAAPGGKGVIPVFTDQAIAPGSGNDLVGLIAFALARSATERGDPLLRHPERIAG